MTNPTFADIKANSDAIEAAYELYKIFMVANGGDDSPIKKKDADDKVVLTGEDFVKNYVLVLYDNWLAQYQSQAKAMIDFLPTLFMNEGEFTGGEFAGIDNSYLGAYLNAEIVDNYKNYEVTYGTLGSSVLRTSSCSTSSRGLPYSHRRVIKAYLQRKLQGQAEH